MSNILSGKVNLGVLMVKHLRCTAVMVLLLLFGAASLCAAQQQGYLDYVLEAVSALETENYDQAVQAIDKAFTLDVNEPLAHVLLATVFAHTNEIDAAIKEYNAALSLASGYPLASYGLAMCSLAKGKIAEAQMILGQIPASGGVKELGPVKAYLESLNGSFKITDSIAKSSQDPLTAQLAGIALFKRGKPEEAEATLEVLAKNIARTGYYEHAGAVITFDKRKPVRFTGNALKYKYTPPKLNDDKLPKVSGTVTLRADLTKARDVKYVLFYVDTRMVGMVNHPPYEYEWNTLNVPNGPHGIKIVGNSEQGLVLTEKSMRVRVANAKPLLGGAIKNEQAEQIAERLWNCIKLKPSLAALYTTLGKLALERKDSKTARDWFEKGMAVHPDYQDVRVQLLKLIGVKNKSKGVWSVPSAGKVIALTFDDGPNERTEDILRILRENGIKATFFIVGSQAEAHPEIVKKIASEGHDIQNHTYTHRALEYVSPIEVEKEVFKTNVIIKDLTGKAPTFLRCPHGRLNDAVGEVADRYGMTRVFWTINASKYEGSVPANMINYVLAKAENGAIVLMHNAEDITIMALPDIIKGLSSKGFKFVTINELLPGR